jgi:hypothetical protein
MGGDPHSILSSAASRPHTVMGRTQPVKARGSMTSGWFPQLVRRNALHASKSNFGVPTKSTLSNGIVCAVASGSALHPLPIPRGKKEGSFNVLMGADSTCRRSSARRMRTYLRGGPQAFLSRASTRGRLRDLAILFSILPRLGGAIDFGYCTLCRPIANGFRSPVGPRRPVTRTVPLPAR